MKKKLILITEFILISLIYYNLKNNEVIEKRTIIVKEFGIITQEDIYTDTIDLRLYTSHGRLKYNN